jgi:hypothetical protein
MTKPAAKYVPTAEKNKNDIEKNKNSKIDICKIEKSKNERRKIPRSEPSIIPRTPPIVVMIKISAIGIL